MSIELHRSSWQSSGCGLGLNVERVPILRVALLVSQMHQQAGVCTRTTLRRTSAWSRGARGSWLNSFPAEATSAISCDLVPQTPAVQWTLSTLLQGNSEEPPLKASHVPPTASNTQSHFSPWQINTFPKANRGRRGIARRGHLKRSGNSAKLQSERPDVHWPFPSLGSWLGNLMAGFPQLWIFLLTPQFNSY